MPRSDQELRRELEQYTSEIKQIDAIDPDTWPDFIQTIIAVENDDPKLADREHMLELTTIFLTDKLAARKQLKHSIDWYRSLLRRILDGFEHPYILLVMMGTVLRNVEDPTEILEEAARLPRIIAGPGSH